MAKRAVAADVQRVGQLKRPRGILGETHRILEYRELLRDSNTCLVFNLMHRHPGALKQTRGVTRPSLQQDARIGAGSRQEVIHHAALWRKKTIRLSLNALVGRYNCL